MQYARNMIGKRTPELMVVLWLLAALLVASLLLAGSAVAITPREAVRAADKAAEVGPWVEIVEVGPDTLRLRAVEHEEYSYTAPCPFVTDCGPCRWDIVRDTTLLVWVRELKGGRFRVRDNLGFRVTVRL